MSVRSTRRLVVLAAAITAVACTKGPGGAALSGAGDGTTAQDSLVRALEESNRLKDSLLAVIFSSDSVLTDIDAKISGVKGLKTGVTPQVAGEQPSGGQAEYRRMVAARVAEVTEQLRRAQARLASDRQRIRELTQGNTALQREIEAWERTVANYAARIDRQQAEIDSLQAQIAVLSQEKAVLEDTLSVMTERENTVYYVVGTKDELKAKGLVKSGGGLLGIGKSWKPASPGEAAAFVRADLRQLHEIPLPRTDREYRIVSQQPLWATDSTTRKKDKFKGSIRLTDPRAFWAASRYLIVMED